MREFADSSRELFPVGDTVARGFLENTDMCGSAEQVLLQCSAESIVDGQCDDQRHHACRDTEYRDHRDDGDDRLFAVRTEVPRCYEELEISGHRCSALRNASAIPIGPSGRRSGNRMTSRIDFA